MEEEQQSEVLSCLLENASVEKYRVWFITVGYKEHTKKHLMYEVRT